MRLLGERAPPPLEVANLVAELREALGGSAFFFLCALAVFPSVHPKLTLTLGRTLDNGEGRAVLSEAATRRDRLSCVESGLSGGPARSAGSTSVEGCRCSLNQHFWKLRLPPLGQWVPVSVLGSRIAQSLFGSRSVSTSGRVGSEYPITDRANQLRYEPLPHFTITATSARGPLSRWRTRQM
jgi:hypothetical protein